jgi:hypothetical protein
MTAKTRLAKASISYKRPHPNRQDQNKSLIELAARLRRRHAGEYEHGGTQGNHNAAKTNRPAGLVVYNKPLKSQHVLFPKRTKRGAIDINRYFA